MGNRTALFSRKQPGGVFTIDDLKEHPGDIYFVNSGHASASDGAGFGRNPDAPFATIQAAIDACVSGQGDTVYIWPGTYAENLTIASKDYVRLVGALPNGYARPDVVPATGIALAITSSQGVVLERMRFASADDHVVTNEGNGFLFRDCVFDGDSNGATDACLLLRGNASDDSYTASEGLVQDCLLRNSGGYGVALDTGSAPGNGVGVTHCVFERCRFLDNTAEDVIALDSGGGVYAAQDNLWRDCEFMSRNKATHVDLDTNLGASNSGNMFRGCYFHDDTIDTTAIKVATADGAIVGCFGLDGVIDGDLLD